MVSMVTSFEGCSSKFRIGNVRATVQGGALAHDLLAGADTGFGDGGGPIFNQGHVKRSYFLPCSVT